MSEFMEWANSMYQFFTSGSYTFVEEAFAQLIIWGMTLWFQIQLWALQFMWSVASAVIDNIGLADVLESAWSGLDPQLRAFLVRYNVPDAINMIINACVARYIWGPL